MAAIINAAERRPPLHQMTIADVIVAVIGLAVALVSQNGVLNLTPVHASVPELLIRLTWFAGGPVLTIAWRRSRGGRGILAGVMAGIITYGAYPNYLHATEPQPDSFSFGLLGDGLIFTAIGALHGLALGITFYGLANVGRLGRSRRIARSRS